MWMIIGIFFLMLLIGVPVAFGVGISSMLYLALNGKDLVILTQRIFAGGDSFTLMAIPLFIFAGEIMNACGVTKRIVGFANELVGFIPGGLAHVNILASMLFAGVSGSTSADVASIGGMLIGSMDEAGFDRDYATAVTAASATIGSIIPPSILMVLYSSITGISVGKLFMAGVIPGILVGVALMLVAYFSSKKNGYGQLNKQPFSWGNVARCTKEAIWALVMPVIVLGGIYGGVFTPTEAAGVAAMYGFIVGVFVYKDLKLKDLPQLLMNSAKSTAMVMIIVGAASSFGWILTSARIPDLIASFLVSLTSNKWVLLLIINFFLLIVGCLMDVTASIIILTPIFMPIISQYGINPIHFGIIMVVNLAIGMSTPPLGVNLFVSCGIAKISIEENAKAMIKFLIANLIALLIITFCEPISTFLPKLMGLM